MACEAEPKWLMFWGHQPQADGGIGKGCLSQWWPCRFMVDEVEYASAEHWMMASKARLFGDADTAALILAARTAAEAKSLGRLVRGFDEQVWAERRFDLVVEGNVAKFGQDPALRDFIVGTKGRVLVPYLGMFARSRLLGRAGWCPRPDPRDWPGGRACQGT